MGIRSFLIALLFLCSTVGYTVGRYGGGGLTGTFKGMFVAQPEDTEAADVLRDAEIDEAEAAGFPRSFGDFDPVERRMIIMMLVLIMILLFCLAYLLRTTIL
jgi:hypothetical protein